MNFSRAIDIHKRLQQAVGTISLKLYHGRRSARTLQSTTQLLSAAFISESVDKSNRAKLLRLSTRVPVVTKEIVTTIYLGLRHEYRRAILLSHRLIHNITGQTAANKSRPSFRLQTRGRVREVYCLAGWRSSRRVCCRVVSSKETGITAMKARFCHS